MNKLSQKEAVKNDPAYQYTYTIRLGPWTSYNLLHDPIHLCFVASRYKFVARLLTGKKRVLEVGCGDAFGTPIVAHFVKEIVALDIDKKIIESNKKRLSRIKNIEFLTLDFRLRPPCGKFEAVYSLDVIEHVEKSVNDVFMQNTCQCLKKEGICIIGTPNITSQQYSSPQSKNYHINLQSSDSLKSLLSRYFKNVFLFSMNDEVVHTGFFPMAHYLFGLGVGVR